MSTNKPREVVSVFTLFLNALGSLEAAILAPTAVNQQKFRFLLHGGNKVETQARFSLIGYAKLDFGIAKYHFEVGAGKENFNWI